MTDTGRDPFSRPTSMASGDEGEKSESPGGPTSSDDSALGLPEPAADPETASAESADAEREVARLRQGLAAREEQLQKVTQAYRSLRKETDRLRTRIEHHQRKRFERSKGDFIGRFVEVLDNLDRAIDAIENSFDSDAVLQGIILVRSRLVQLLREEGLEKIFVGGQPFDPTHSEAAGIEAVEDASQDNVVIRELQRGYMLKGALLRPARVVVGRYAGGRVSEDSTGGGDSTSPDVAGDREDTEL